MSKHQDVISAIDNLSLKIDSFNGRLNAIEECIKTCDERQRMLETAQHIQAENLNELTEKIEALANSPSNIVWQNGNQVGVEKEKVYDIIDGLNLKRNSALKGLVKQGKIMTQYDNGVMRKTPQVRISPTKTKRVIIVLM